MTKTTCFISYPWAKGLNSFAHRLAEALSNHGIEAGIDQEQILSTDDLGVRIQNGIKHASDIFLLILTAETLQAEACIAEIESASASGKPFIVILIDAVEMPARLKKLTFVDFTIPLVFPAAVDRLVKEIGKFDDDKERSH